MKDKQQNCKSEVKMTSKYLKTIVKTQKTFIKELLDRLAQREEDRCLDLISEKFYMSINGSSYPLELIKNLLNDTYFKGLTLEQILELAKKSIRLATDNCDMTHKLEDLLEKAKINGDNFYVNEITVILKSQDF